MDQALLLIIMSQYFSVMNTGRDCTGRDTGRDTTIRTFTIIEIIAEDGASRVASCVILEEHTNII